MQGGGEMGDRSGNKEEQIIKPISRTLIKKWKRRRIRKWGCGGDTCDLRMWEAEVG